MISWFAMGIAVAAVLLAALLYFVLLPHVEGPSLDDQRPSYKQWLVRCPDCETWAWLTPVSTQVDDSQLSQTNWYRCQTCEHRWHERHEQ